MIKKVVFSILILIIIYLAFNLKVTNAESVKTMKIVIDPGHGGYETGAINYNDGIIEKDITLKTSRYLKEYLEDYYGVQVIMTHNGISNDKELEVIDRGMCARNNNADLLLCLHFNSAESEELHGAEVFVTSNKTCYKYNEESTQIGNKILTNLTKLGIYNRGVKTRLCNDVGPKWEYSDGSKADYYGIIRYAMKGNAEDRGVDITKGLGITSILIEHCFIKGKDVQFINTDAKLKKLAESDGQAIVEHYKLKLKKDVPSEVILNKNTLNMILGEKNKIDVSINPVTAQNKKVNWSSNNNKVAIVDQNGNITAVGVGNAIITATADGNDKIFSKVNVNVKDNNISIQNGLTSDIILNKEMQIFLDTQIDKKYITWSSSDESIVKVNENGIVKGIKEGSANITAYSSQYNKKAVIKINVNTLKDGESIKIEKYKEQNGVISNFERLTAKEDFIKNIKVTGDLKVRINTDKNVGSKTKIEILRGNKVLQNYTCKLYGDVNGDGKISVMDYVIIKNKILGIEDVNDDITKDVADVSKDGKISVMDYVIIKNDILNIEKIGVR